jgi:hypothetical protein
MEYSNDAPILLQEGSATTQTPVVLNDKIVAANPVV